MNIKHILILLIGVMLSSCSTVNHTAHTAQVNTKLMACAVADLDVNPQKIALTYKWNFHLFRGVNVEEVKRNTTARLLQQANADALVEPQYIVEHRGFLRGGSVTVMGFPAKYRNFRKPTAEETLLIETITEKEAIVKTSTGHKKFIFF